MEARRNGRTDGHSRFKYGKVEIDVEEVMHDADHPTKKNARGGRAWGDLVSSSIRGD
jgi:hypothetical protein